MCGVDVSRLQDAMPDVAFVSGDLLSYLHIYKGFLHHAFATSTSGVAHLVRCRPPACAHPCWRRPRHVEASLSSSSGPAGVGVGAGVGAEETPTATLHVAVAAVVVAVAVADSPVPVPGAALTSACVFGVG